jgi:hypothetical protein
VGSNLVLSILLDGNSQHIKAMPGSIPAPNSGSFVEIKIYGANCQKTFYKKIMLMKLIPAGNNNHFV